MFAVVLAAGLCLTAFLKLLPQDFVTCYLVAVLGLVIVGATGYSWLAFVKALEDRRSPAQSLTRSTARLEATSPR
jgi:hypothetical protein